MKTRRWMKSVLTEAKKDQIDMPWSRWAKTAKKLEKHQLLKAAS
jgi:hypothetical protein